MAQRDITAKILPWLQRWGLADLAQGDPWLHSMALRSFAVDDFLVRSGDTDDTLYLINSGLVRLFYLTPDGRERNKAFYRSGQVTGPVSAALTASPAPFSIQCMEPVESICFSYRAFTAAANRVAGINALQQQLLADAFVRNEQREAMLLTCNAEQRYQWLLDNEADLVGRIAQFHIASYLGIDAVSLSRLKRKHRQ
ncbi:Crp/Fnr family transcriptional regulator [Pseudohalioglobus lutimaris]|uniref:Crp/Fnr family transcriptional regulator n=1 Tax=Pseudohalioglobus lutimaris TaxID=1737061 RepID=A0A2N5X244_9GAMM|nr:Crp/Fnr family transcriptional regulator [Pseudohalioglobus lutimaris]PLW68548.1 Crp/Fnr family transcriptional regulator [Pseudohalioglobus lutimaris]